jgi:hypothetical protein
MPQVKTRYGGEYHHIKEVKPDMYITDCGIKVRSNFRYPTNIEITCEKCLKIKNGEKDK